MHAVRSLPRDWDLHTSYYMCAHLQQQSVRTWVRMYIGTQVDAISNLPEQTSQSRLASCITLQRTVIPNKVECIDATITERTPIRLGGGGAKRMRACRVTQQYPRCLPLCMYRGDLPCPTNCRIDIGGHCWCDRKREGRKERPRAEATLR